MQTFTKDKISSILGIDFDTNKGTTTAKETTSNPPIICGAGTSLSGNTCVSNSQPNPVTQPTPQPLPEPKGNPVLTPPSSNVQCFQPSGFFSIVYNRQKAWVHEGAIISGIENTEADVIGIFKYTGNCPADIYIEAGINNEPVSGLLTFLPFGGQEGAPSNCDGNTHYNGFVFQNVQPNQDLKFRLRPQNYDVEGTYPINIGAYWGGTRTGCVNFGGMSIAKSLNGRVSFSDKYSVFELANYVQMS